MKIYEILMFYNLFAIRFIEFRMLSVLKLTNNPNFNFVIFIRQN